MSHVQIAPPQFITALPWAISNKLARYEVDWISGSQDMQIIYKQAGRFLALQLVDSQLTKDKTWGITFRDHVGSVNLTLNEPHRTMHRQPGVLVLTPFRQVIICLWVVTVIVQ